MIDFAKLAEHRDDTYRDFAVMHDLSAYDLNRLEERGTIDGPYPIDPVPFEVSGDALALYKASHR